MLRLDRSFSELNNQFMYKVLTLEIMCKFVEKIKEVVKVCETRVLSVKTN